MEEPAEEKLRRAARYGNVSEVKEILRNNPTLNVNWKRKGVLHFGDTALHIASARGYDSIVSILLAHPNVDVNQKDNNGSTPFLWACRSGKTSCVRLLLKDQRVTVDERNIYGHTSLWYAAKDGRLLNIKWWIASGREMDLGQPGNERTDAIGGAKIAGKTEVVALFERFKEKPVATRHHLRVELGMIDEMAAEMFALVVFVSDGLLQISQTSTPASQFFTIASQLPLELQMVLCSRVAGSVEEMILTNNSEVAFKALATKCWFA